MKESLAEKLKYKMLNNEKVRSAIDEIWNVQFRVFREILEPAFVDDLVARAELVVAVSNIGKSEFDKALKGLDKMSKYCKTAADETARLFFMGFACERCGDNENAIEFLSLAAKTEPQFYLLYTMLGKLLYDAKDFDASEANFNMAIHCLDNREKLDEVPVMDEKNLYASIYGNLALCLLKMGRYDDAEWALYESEKNAEGKDELMVTWAMLYAATDRTALAREKMAQLREKNSELESETVLMLEELIAGKNPRFKVQTKAVEEAGYDEFWQWFLSANDLLLSSLNNNEPEYAVNEIYEQLDKVFEFMKSPVEFGISADEGRFTVNFCDNYNATLSAGLDKLCKTAPDKLKESWSFTVIR